MKHKVYMCPMCQDAITDNDAAGLMCQSQHRFPYLDGTYIPVFARDKSVNEYSIEKAAEIHDNALLWVFKTYHMEEEDLRRQLISKLNLQQGQSILITGAGAGNDLPHLAPLVGTAGTIFAQDYAAEMLANAAERTKNAFDLGEYNIEFSVSDAVQLPFQNSSFDAVYHFGGLNLFSNIPMGISEMDRVVKEGGRVVFGDEGLAPWLKETERGKLIINNNPLCDYEPPLAHIPATARNLNLTWDPSHCFYIIDYTASKTELPLDMDVVHVGTRGGTMRKRYYGQLEGVDPDLKAALYAKAAKRGESRVDYIERLLRDGLETGKPE